MKPKPYHRTILPYSAFLNRSGYWNNAYGNITSMPHINTLAYDQDDQLKVAIFPTTGYMAFYCYDSAGERVRKVVHKPGGIVEQRIYLGGYEIFRKTTGGTLNLERETLTISDDQKAIVRVETKTVENGTTISNPTSNQRYQYDNHLGSACLELDSTAAIISYEEYHPFGTTSYRAGREVTEVSLKRYKYCGKERDEETGLYYYGARYYAAWLGRFVTVDPLKEKRSWVNPYNYVQNNPLNRVDPTGALDDDPPKGANPELYEYNSDVIQSNNGSKIEKSPTAPDEPEPYKFTVSLNQLKEYFPKANSDVLKELEKNLNKHMGDFGIDNNLKLAHFLSQAGHETGGFKKSSVTESLDYSVDGLLGIFGKYFIKEAPKEGSKNNTVYVAGDYGRKEGQAAKQKEIGNIVYGSRMGNEGEGYKYRGRGIFQLTGKYNYELFSDFYQNYFDSTNDFASNPNLIADNSEIALISALWFFEKNVLKKMDVNKNTTVEDVTRKINGGQNGVNERKAIFSRIRKKQN